MNVFKTQQKQIILKNTWVNDSLKFIKMTEIHRVVFLNKMLNYYFRYNSLKTPSITRK
jgi:hypothetical protein